MIKESCYIIMSKDRKLIARGIPRNRYLCLVGEDTSHRIMTYTSKGRADANKCGFYYTEVVKEYMKSHGVEIRDEYEWESNNLEAVPCNIIVEIPEDMKVE